MRVDCSTVGYAKCMAGPLGRTKTRSRRVQSQSSLEGFRGLSCRVAFTAACRVVHPERMSVGERAVATLRETRRNRE